jgi:transcriptional regulator with XRE-family HTH domain
MSDEDASLDEALGMKIHARRKALGLTLRQVSERSGLTYGFLSELENGKKSVSVRNLYALAAALDCRPHDLLPDEPHAWLDDVASL